MLSENVIPSTEILSTNIVTLGIGHDGWWRLMMEIKLINKCCRWISKYVMNICMMPFLKQLKMYEYNKETKAI